MQLYQLKFPNGKSYIGITSKTAIERFKVHCRPSKDKIVHKAIHKYGKDNVVITVLATVDNWELLCLAEQEAIDKFNTFLPNGYNQTKGGEGNLGFKWADLTNHRCSKYIKPLSNTTKQKMSDSANSRFKKIKEVILNRCSQPISKSLFSIIITSSKDSGENPTFKPFSIQSNHALEV